MIVSGLKVREPWVDLLLSGRKTYEMRQRPTFKRETIGLIQSGTDKIVGVATITDCLGPLDDAQLAATRHLHQADPGLLAERNWRYAWAMEGARRLSKPVPYVQRSGPVLFVTLDPETAERLDRALAVA